MAAAAGAVDVMIVSLGSTAGLRAADSQLADSLRRAGASVSVLAAQAPAETRTLMLTDLGWARAARAAATRALQTASPRAMIYSSTTAALLWPRPGAIRFDAPSSANRPGRHGLWQRPLERRRLAQSALLLPWSEGALREAGEQGAQAEVDGRTLIVPVAVEPSGAPIPSHERDIAAITYAANPHKKGLDRVLAAWRELRAARPQSSGEELVVAGAHIDELVRAGVGIGGEEGGVRVVGPLAAAEYRALLRRARVFVCAPRREDYGIAQLEALADGCMLVTNAAPGPYAALAIARALDARLVGEDLAGSLRAALDRPAPDYAARAGEALSAFGEAALDATVAERLLPRLLA